ncbi:MAG: prevent-host-death protein [Candidatus Lindowbacteria bacterium RIFCSPLOWO2_12_FULL_62_27]|nr:MAG: prevent-host-death protein [Candidatus Lindowbacteria bacterium RIFCSPLOWO2_02_FULL_62_12]OGH62383.1 MAG: prevent-host-death protein [Candidatus Lindowbacteria bacterium RIFCSPLOWO2_12_FULL_62_27]
MVKLNMHAAKTHLSRYIKRVQKGETILICRRNIPIAEIRPVPQPPARRRPVGLDKGKIRIPKSFYDPLPDDLTNLFNGRKS